MFFIVFFSASSEISPCRKATAAICARKACHFAALWRKTDYQAIRQAGCHHGVGLRMFWDRFASFAVYPSYLFCTLIFSNFEFDKATFIDETKTHSNEFIGYHYGNSIDCVCVF